MADKRWTCGFPEWKHEWRQDKPISDRFLSALDEIQYKDADEDAWDCCIECMIHYIGKERVFRYAVNGFIDDLDGQNTTMAKKAAKWGTKDRPTTRDKQLMKHILGGVY